LHINTKKKIWNKGIGNKVKQPKLKYDNILKTKVFIVELFISFSCEYCIFITINRPKEPIRNIRLVAVYNIIKIYTEFPLVNINWI
jgi:hypothetical protein